MANNYNSILKPKGNAIITKTFHSSEHQYTPKSLVNTPQKPLQKSSFLPKPLISHRKNIYNIGLRAKTEVNEEETSRSQSKSFVIKTKSRNIGLMSPEYKASMFSSNARNESGSQSTQSTQQKHCWINDADTTNGNTEMISIRDEQFINLLNSENLQEKNINLESLVNDNPDYFNHLLGFIYNYNILL